MKEIVTDQQKKKVDSIEATCAQCLADDAQAKLVEEQKKLKEKADKLSQDLAKKADEAIANLKKSIDLLIKTISGNMTIDEKELSSEKIIDELKKLLDPVISFIKSLPVPEIPGLSDLTKLMTKLEAVKEDKTMKKPGMPDFEPSPELMKTFWDLLAAIQSLCTTLPVVLINVIFQMMSVIVDMFKQIAGVLGIPSVPYPLTLVPQCMQAIPTVTAFVLQAPMKIGDVAYAKLKQLTLEMMNMQFPDTPDEITAPSAGAVCPDHQEESQSDQDPDNKDDSLGE